MYNYKAKGDPGVIMTGTITVGNIGSPVTRSSPSNTANSNSSIIDTVDVIMVPTQDIDS